MDRAVAERRQELASLLRDAGETADVLILSKAMIDKLAAAGRAAAGADVAKTFVAVCVRDGAPAPDIATVEAFKRTLLGARAVAMSDPAVGGSAAVYVPVVFERLGIAEAMKPKCLLQQNGVEVARRRRTRPPRIPQASRLAMAGSGTIETLSTISVVSPPTAGMVRMLRVMVSLAAVNGMPALYQFPPFAIDPGTTPPGAGKRAAELASSTSLR